MMAILFIFRALEVKIKLENLQCLNTLIGFRACATLNIDV